MPKLPYLALYTGDWLKDPRLSMCSAATRGIWLDLLCAMHEDGRRGKLSGSRDQLSRLCRCSAAEFDSAIRELQTTSAAEISESNREDDPRHAVVTVICRRMQRESKEREGNRKRQGRRRDREAGHEDVTPPSAPVSRPASRPASRRKQGDISVSSSTSVSKTSPPPSGALSDDFAGHVREAEAEESWMQEGRAEQALTRELARRLVEDCDLADVGGRDGCLTLALKAGLPPAEVGAIIDHWETQRQTRGWEKEALWWRLRKAVAGVAADQGWPQGSPTVQRDRQREQDLQQAEQRRRMEAERKKQKAQTYEQLEREFGPVLDAMPFPEQLELAGRIGDQLAKRLRQKGKPEGRSLRGPLLGLLSGRKSG